MSEVEQPTHSCGSAGDAFSAEDVPGEGSLSPSGEDPGAQLRAPGLLLQHRKDTKSVPVPGGITSN